MGDRKVWNDVKVSFSTNIITISSPIIAWDAHYDMVCPVGHGSGNELHVCARK